jgi:hypothetical protein
MFMHDRVRGACNCVHGLFGGWFPRAVALGSVVGLEKSDSPPGVSMSRRDG